MSGPTVVDTSVSSFRPIVMSPRDTCATQQQIAAHNGVYDTLATGRTVAYVAPCDMAKSQSPVKGPAPGQSAPLAQIPRAPKLLPSEPPAKTPVAPSNGQLALAASNPTD